LRSFDASEYDLKIFKDLGFTRNKCSVCGQFFWSLNPNQRQCGDAPCVTYSFIGNPPGRTLTLDQVRAEFVGFFQRKGHTFLNFYPVVCRWRDDLYLNDASIVNFQPYTTNGIVPPPANPLVVVQPCIRLVDLDLVALTLGRHLSSFEMGGYHAFNSAQWGEIYWKDQTVDYCQQFLTEALKIPGEAITYKENIWSGGGNAGPCLEVLVGGLEVSTLVFMKFKELPNGDLVELPVRTVDTGTGMERNCWLLSGSPTAFQAVYGPLLEKTVGLAGLSIDDDFLASYAKVASGFSFDKGNVLEIRSVVATKMGLNVNELLSKIQGLDNIFRVLDHVRSLILVLSEGIVPSNVGVGYLARLLYRRTARLLQTLNIFGSYRELVKWEVDYWGKAFPSLVSAERDVLEVLEAEEGKFLQTTRRGEEMVGRMLEKESAEEVTGRLVELYDSHGLPPEFVADISAKRGMRIEVPNDFYGLVAKRHRTAPPPKADERALRLEAETKDLAATRLLYYEDPNLLECSSKVLKVLEDNLLVLDRTTFYAEGGGQPPDHGKMTFEGSCDVVNVEKVRDIVVHKVEGMVPKEGAMVQCHVDPDRRASLRRSHTSTHIVNGSAREVLGNHVWQTGAQKGVVESRLDITHYRALSHEEIDAIEKVANRIVMRNLPVSCSFLPRNVAESKYGFRLYQGGAVPAKEVRVVSIDDWEAEACGGIHLNSTGEAGVIKVVKVERIQDGVERITFRAGPPAIDFIQGLERRMRESSSLMGVPAENLVPSIENIQEELKRFRKMLEERTKAEASTEAERLLSGADEIGGVRCAVYVAGEELDYLIELGRDITSTEVAAICVLFSISQRTEFVAFANKGARERGFDAGAFAAELARKFDGGGGGKPTFGKGGVGKALSAEELRSLTVQLLRASLGRT
jgi:alanyl-tRNA synthetase